MKTNFPFVFLLLSFLLIPSSININHVYVVKSDSNNYVYVHVFLNESKNITIFISDGIIIQQYITFNQNALLGFHYGVIVYFVSQTPFTVNNVTVKYNPDFYGYTFSFKALNNTTFYINFLPKPPPGDEPYSNVITPAPPPPQPYISPPTPSSSSNEQQNILQTVCFLFIIVLVIIISFIVLKKGK